jgi:hypothetical protein
VLTVILLWQLNALAGKIILDLADLRVNYGYVCVDSLLLIACGGSLQLGV